MVLILILPTHRKPLPAFSFMRRVRARSRARNVQNEKTLTAVMHRQGRDACSAEWEVGWHRCRCWPVVDGVISALMAFQGLCLLETTNHVEGVEEERQLVS